MSNLTFAFDGNQETPQSLARKRAAAEALLQSAVGRAPQNVGEGLNAIGQAIAGRVQLGRARKGEAAGQQSANAAFAPILSALGGTPATPPPVQQPSSGGGNFIRNLFSSGGGQQPSQAAPQQPSFAGGGSIGQGGRSFQNDGGALFSLDNRSINRPSGDFTNVSLDFNAVNGGGARGALAVIPDNASPELRAATQGFIDDTVALAQNNGFETKNRGLINRSANGRGVSNTVHLEPFFNDNVEFQKFIKENPSQFSEIIERNFGGLSNTRIIPPHGVGNDRGASSSVFGNETNFGEFIINDIIQRRTAAGKDVNEPVTNEEIQQSTQSVQQSLPDDDFRSPNQRQQPQGAPQQRQQSGGGVQSVTNDQLFSVINNPFASRSQISTAQTILNQRLAADAPLTRAQRQTFANQDRAHITGRQDRAQDVNFRESEARRSQFNTDRTHIAGRQDRGNDVAFRNQEAKRAQFNANRGFDADQEQLKFNNNLATERFNLTRDAAQREAQAAQTEIDRNVNQRNATLNQVDAAVNNIARPLSPDEARDFKGPTVEFDDGRIFAVHEGLHNAQGSFQGRLPSFLAAPFDAQNVDDFRDATKKLLEGQAFKAAFETLKGAGQITEFESKSAAAALGAIQSSTISPEELVRQTLILQNAIRTGLQKLDGGNQGGGNQGGGQFEGVSDEDLLRQLGG